MDTYIQFNVQNLYKPLILDSNVYDIIQIQVYEKGSF